MNIFKNREGVLIAEILYYRGMSLSDYMQSIATLNFMTPKPKLRLVIWESDYNDLEKTFKEYADEIRVIEIAKIVKSRILTDVSQKSAAALKKDFNDVEADEDDDEDCGFKKKKDKKSYNKNEIPLPFVPAEMTFEGAVSIARPKIVMTAESVDKVRKIDLSFSFRFIGSRLSDVEDKAIDAIYKIAKINRGN